MNPLAIESIHMENYIIQSQDVYGNGTYAEIRNFSNNGDPFGGDLESRHLP